MCIMSSNMYITDTDWRPSSGELLRFSKTREFWSSKANWRVRFSLPSLGTLSKDAFERRTSTGSEAFSLFICLDANKLVLLSFFSLLKTIYPRVSTKPLPNDAKSPLPVDVRPWKMLLLKLPNHLNGPLTKLGPVVRKPISAEPGVKFKPGSFLLCLKAFSRIIFCAIFRASNHQLVDKKN